MEVTRTQKAEEINTLPRPVKVIFVEISLDIGGEERVLQTLLKIADKAILQPVIAVLKNKGHIANELEKSDIIIHDRLISRNYDPRGVGALAQIARQENADIIYCANMPMPMIYSWLVKRRTRGSKMIVAFHTMGDIRRPWWRNRVTNFIGRHADGFVAVSNGQKEYFIRNNRIPRDKTEVIYLGVDANRFSASKYEQTVRHEFGVPEDAQVVGILATLRPVKNHSLFLQMAKSVIAQRNVYFFIVGDGTERSRLESLVKELGLVDNVKFLGDRSDIPEVLRAFDISVMSSKSEALPVSMLESMSMELPVVSTNVGSIGEVVVDGVTGYLTPEGDADALTEKVLYLLGNPDKAKEMGKAGRKRVEEKFTRELMVKHFEDFFIKLSEQHNTR